MEIIAHRGAHLSRNDENTVAAFSRAVGLGCHMIELDVRLTRDNALVVCHDKNIEFGGRLISVGASRLEDLVEGKVVIDKITNNNIHRPPTLELVLKLFLDRIKINIELKDSASGAAFVLLLKRLFYREILQSGFESKIIVSSFLRDEIWTVRQSFPDIEAALLMKNFNFSFEDKKALISWLRRSGIEAVHLDEESVTDRKVILFFRDHGLKTRLYTVNDPNTLADYSRFGIEGVFTDKPEKLLSFEQNRYLSPNCDFCSH